jgi:hypothetical protein
MKTLDGKKTYIGIALLFILGGLKAIGAVDENTYSTLLPFIGGLTAFGLRSALSK